MGELVPATLPVAELASSIRGYRERIELVIDALMTPAPIAASDAVAALITVSAEMFLLLHQLDGAR